MASTRYIPINLFHDVQIKKMSTDPKAMHRQLNYLRTVTIYSIKCIIHLHHQAMQTKMERTCNRLLRKTCSGIPPSEDAKHARKH